MWMKKRPCSTAIELDCLMLTVVECAAIDAAAAGVLADAAATGGYVVCAFGGVALKLVVKFAAEIGDAVFAAAGCSSALFFAIWRDDSETRP